MTTDEAGRICNLMDIGKRRNNAERMIAMFDFRSSSVPVSPAISSILRPARAKRLIREGTWDAKELGDAIDAAESMGDFD